ncbi:MAG: energy transducer TonB [Gemmatimonadota bacterium]
MIKRSLILVVAVSAFTATAACSEPQPETPPRQLSDSPFHYPEELWDAGVEGETLLEIHVSREGLVDSAQVGESSGYGAFDSAAVAGARELLFEPARRGADSVAVRVLLPVQFHLPRADSSAAGAASEAP